MDLIIQQWDGFKHTWSQKIDKSHSFLFNEFDNFILNELKQFEKNNTVKKILIFNKPVKNIFYKNNTLYIYESPFYMIFKEKRFPSALLIETILQLVQKFIENNSLYTVKIIKSLINNNLKEEEEEEKEEEE